MKRSEKIEIITRICEQLAREVITQLEHNPLPAIDMLSPIDLLTVGLTMIEHRIEAFADSPAGKDALAQANEAENAAPRAASVTPFRRPGPSNSTH
jgi:hypothetical protein